MSGREYMAAAAVQSEITTRIVVRQRQGVNPMEPKQRIVHGVKCCKFLGRELYNPEAMLRDKDTRLGISSRSRAAKASMKAASSGVVTDYSKER